MTRTPLFALLLLAGCEPKNDPVAIDDLPPALPKPAPQVAPPKESEPGPLPPLPVTDAVPPLTDSDRAKLKQLEKAGASVHGPGTDGGYTVRVEAGGDLAAALSHLKGLKCVTELTLASDKLTDDDLAVVAGFDALRSFSLHECPRVTGTGFGALAKLPRLKVVSVVGPVGDAACLPLGQLKALEEVVLVQTKITDAGLKALAALPALDAINLTGTPLTGSAFASEGWAKLREINAAQTAFTDAGLDAAAGLPGLEVLTLDATRVSDAGLKHLGRAKTLQELSLAETPVTDAGVAALAGMKELRVLNLERTAVTGSAFAEFPTTSGLRKLNLAETKFTDASGKHLSRFTALTNLSLSGCEVSDEGLTALRDLKKLTNLDLSDTKAGDGTAKLTGALAELEIASFKGAQLTDAGLKQAAQAPRLRFLYVRGSKVTKRGAIDAAKFAREGVKIVAE